jgi:hypothetical protein
LERVLAGRLGQTPDVLPRDAGKARSAILRLRASGAGPRCPWRRANGNEPIKTKKAPPAMKARRRFVLWTIKL